MLNEENDLFDRELTRQVEELCLSKAEEFKLIGYDVSPENIWLCVSERYKKEIPPLYQVVNDILSLKINKFMNWLMKEAWQGKET